MFRMSVISLAILQKCQIDFKNPQYIISLSVLVGSLSLSQHVQAHIEYYDLNQGAQISDLTATGKAASTVQYGANPVITGTNLNTISDRALNDTSLWNASNQVYTGVGQFKNTNLTVVGGNGNPQVTSYTSFQDNIVDVNDVTDWGWGGGTWGGTSHTSSTGTGLLEDTHKVDFFNFRLLQTSNVTITWNVDDRQGDYIDNGFSLYRGVASYQAHDDATDPLNPKSGVPPHKIQSVLDANVNNSGYGVIDAQGNASLYRDTLTNTVDYIGQFDALNNWGDGNAAGNWSNLVYIANAHSALANTNTPVLIAAGTNGFSTNANDTLETLSISLPAGNYTIAASGAFGSAFQNAATNNLSNLHGQLTFKAVATIQKKDQTITFGAAPVLAINASSNISAVASSGLPISFLSTTPVICKVSGSVVTALNAGICIISADQQGNANYKPAPQKLLSVQVSKISQAIILNPAPALIVKGTGVLVATASSGLDVIFTSTTPAVCSVIKTVITGMSAGVCNIVATQGGNTHYSPATQKTISIQVAKGNSTIIFVPKTYNPIAWGEKLTVVANSSSGLGVNLTSQSLGICTISGNVVTGVSPGNCIIAANQPATTQFNAALQKTVSIAINKQTQTLTVSGLPKQLLIGQKAVLQPKSSSGLMVALQSTTPAICSISSGTIKGVAAGTCKIMLSQAGTPKYLAASLLASSLIKK